MTAFIIILTLMMITTFQGIFGYLYEYEEIITHIEIQSDTVMSFQSLKDAFCPASGNITMAPISYTGVPKTHGDICKEKCQRYLMCTGTDNQSGFINLLSNGSYSVEKEFPHMALIGYKYWEKTLWNCGGSLISEKFVLTAAHCLKFESVNASMVRLGVTNIKDTTHLLEVEVDNIIHHPKYKQGMAYHDIGLLRLSSTIYFNDYIKPICLHLEEDFHLLRKQPIVIGWGELRKDSRRPENLLKVELEFYDHNKCNTFYKPRGKKIFTSKVKHGIMKDIMICAGSPDSVKNICQGDSGGPLQVHNGDTYVLVGVASFGEPCVCAKNRPSVYTRVSSYLKWIVEHVWPETFYEV